MQIRPNLFAILSVSCLLAFSADTHAQCPEQPPLQNWTGAGQVVCPCFVSGERAGAVLNLPPEDFPIEILRVGIGWSSQFGGGPDVIEQAIRIYGAGLPDPGTPIFSLDGPQLTDGVINEFDLEPLPGEIIVPSGPFTVALEFLNSNAGDPFSPTVVHDGNGCQAGKNVVYAIPGGWQDACVLGVTGDWVIHVVYRQVTCGAATLSGSVPDGATVPGTPLTVSKLGSNLLLSWSASCVASDTNYEIYEGTIGSYYDHHLKLCDTGGATGAVISPAAASSYYLAVPQNAEGEGSYGRDSTGAERPVGTSQCKVQHSGACP
jgi:hypothetical protein